MLITTKLKKEHLFHFIESQSFTMSFPFFLEINSIESTYNANHNKIEERTSFPFHRITKLNNVFPLFLEINSIESTYNVNHNKIEERTSFPFYITMFFPFSSSHLSYTCYISLINWLKHIGNDPQTPP
jgi:hypothetical protein